MADVDLEIYYWLKNLSTLHAAVIGGIVSGLVIVFCQWFFRWQFQNIKVDVETHNRLLSVAKGEWPEHIRQSARDRIRKRYLREIKKTVLILLLCVAVAVVIYKLYSGWSEKNDELIRTSRLERIENIDSYKGDLKRKTNKTRIKGSGEVEVNQFEMEKWELICSWRALNEVNEHNFKGYIDIDRILKISRSYQACMLEQGWSTEPCAENEEDCFEIPYKESICTSFTRDWLDDRSIIPDTFFLGCNVE